MDQNAERYEWSFLVLRLALGISFLIHGIAKLQMGLPNVAGFFQSMGLPGFMAYAVAYFELLGGIALILGFATRLVSLLVAFLMIGATLKVKLAAGFLGSAGALGYELDVAFFAMALALILSGSRLFSVDKMMSVREIRFNRMKEKAK